MAVSLNTKAAELRRKLFELQNEFCQLSLDAKNAARGASQVLQTHEATQQIDTAMYALREVYDSLGDVFIDVYRDYKDQSFALNCESTYELSE